MTVNPAYITVPTKKLRLQATISSTAIISPDYFFSGIGSFFPFHAFYMPIQNSKLVHALLIVPSLLQMLQLLKDIALINEF